MVSTSREIAPRCILENPIGSGNDLMPPVAPFTNMD